MSVISALLMIYLEDVTIIFDILALILLEEVEYLLFSILVINI